MHLEESETLVGCPIFSDKWIMASPQKENGFTSIANEIVDALMKVNLSASESRVLWFLFRKTYGWEKKTEWLALSQFSKGTGIDRRLVHRTLKKLSSKKMIVIYRDDTFKIRYGFQKDYEKWKLSSKQMTVINSVPKVSSKQTPTKESITKEKKENKKRKFIPPTLKEIKAYCIKRNNSVDPQKFLDHYEANGWMRGKNKIVSWEACIRTWESNQKNSDNVHRRAREWL